MTLETYLGRVPTQRTLLPRLLDEGVGMATVDNRNGVPSLQLFRKVIERRASGSLSEIERLLAPQALGQGTVARNVTEELLAAVTRAYPEAAGREVG